jgi:hypothetical protein
MFQDDRARYPQEQQPFSMQPQQPSWQQNSEWQGYQNQMQDLQNRMRMYSQQYQPQQQQYQQQYQPRGRGGFNYGGRGGYEQQMPQQDYGYGQMQNQMRQQAAFGQQQRQQYGGLGALQQYLQPPAYRPPVVAPLPLDPNLTMPKPAPPPPPVADNYTGVSSGF